MVSFTAKRPSNLALCVSTSLDGLLAAPQAGLGWNLAPWSTGLNVEFHCSLRHSAQLALEARCGALHRGNFRYPCPSRVFLRRRD